MAARFRIARAALCALVVLAMCAPAAGAVELRPVTGKLRVKIGIADQKAEIFADARLRGLGLRYVRRSVAWDALRSKSQSALIEAWLAGARAMGAEPLITFSRASGVRGRTPPAPFAFLREFQRFHKRFPQVKTFSTWNEANLCGAATCRRPDLVARYYNAIRRNCIGCKVLAADVLDRPNMVQWARAFRRAAGFEPKYWGLHDYVDANRFETTQAKALLREVKGEVWLTEIGGLVARRNNSEVRLPQGKAHAAQATRFIFDRLARIDRRITRVYLYHWSSSTARDSWDSAFIGSDGKPRPALAVLRRVLRQMRG